MELHNCIWTKQCAADSLSGHWKVWKDSKSKSSDPPWSAKQGFLQLWQKVVDKCKLSSLSLTTVIILIDTPYQKFDHCLLLVDDSIKMTMMTTTMILLVQKAARREMSCLAMMTSPGLWENTTSAHHRILSPKWLLCSQRCVAAEGAGGNSTVLIHLELKSLLDYRAEVDQSGHHDQLGQVVKVS